MPTQFKAKLKYLLKSCRLGLGLVKNRNLYNKLGQMNKFPQKLFNLTFKLGWIKMG